MNILGKNGFWATIITVCLGIFTSFNTYQLRISQETYDNLQLQIKVLNENLNNLNDRLDNVYEIVTTRKGDK